MLETPKRDRQAERREATREEILEHAWALSREHGLTGLSLRELAGRVGLKAPSLYSYFDSKLAIYDAMFAQGCRAFAEEEESLVPPEVDAADHASVSRYVGWMLRVFVDFCTADPVRHQLLYQRTIPGFEPSPESFALSVASHQHAVEMLEDLGLDGAGTIDLLTAIGSGLASQQLANDPGGDRWARLAEEAGAMFVAHVRARDAAPTARPRPRRAQESPA